MSETPDEIEAAIQLGEGRVCWQKGGDVSKETVSEFLDRMARLEEMAIEDIERLVRIARRRGEAALMVHEGLEIIMKSLKHEHSEDCPVCNALAYDGTEEES